MKPYFDNAATTPMDVEVIKLMGEIYAEHFGNPSSIHATGRKARAIIEDARKTVAKTINASVGEIFFTGSATEANNTIIHGAINDLGVRTIISSPTEHDCVLERLDMESQKGCNVVFLEVDDCGEINLQLLRDAIIKAKDDGKVMVSVMHANNEIGTLHPIEEIGALCEELNAYFHTDTVQSMGKIPIDVATSKVHFLSGSAHKFHGPKGVGFFFMSNKSIIKPMIVGGAQERNMRSGTENVAGIAGLAKALQIMTENRNNYVTTMIELRDYFEHRLQEEITGININAKNAKNRMPHISSVSFPEHEKGDLLVLNLDINGIAVSSGSACSSGIEQDSHVLQAIGHNASRKTVRFSFSHRNTKEEIDYTIEKLKSII